MLRPRLVIVVLLLLGFLAVVPAGRSFAYAGLALWALRSPRHALEALSLSWLVTFINPGLWPGGDIGLRWLVILAGFGTVTATSIRRRLRIPVPILALWLFVVMAAASGLFSYAVSLSLVKVAGFAMGATTVLLGFYLTRNQINVWSSWFATLFVLVIVLSIPVYFVDAGFLRDGVGFQGLFNHPQAFGVILAPAVVWLFAGFVDKEKPSILLSVVLAAGLILLFLTRARGPVLALVLGIVLMSSVKLARGLLRPRASLTVGPGYRALLLMGVAIVLLVGFWAGIQQETSAFISKGTEGSLVEAFGESRGFLIERSLANFEANILSGIGFGLPSQPTDLRPEANVLGIPTSAPVEKGFLATALLEETGVFGTVFFVLTFFLLGRQILVHANPAVIGVFAVSVLTNFGEDTLFSFGGLGLYLWLLVGWAWVDGLVFDRSTRRPDPGSMQSSPSVNELDRRY